MMRNQALLSLVVLVLVRVEAIDAYEIGTHHALTASALAGSVFQSPPPGTLGLREMLHISDPAKTFPDEFGNAAILDELIPRSAQLEDGLNASLPELARVLNHFFDPLTGFPLMYFVNGLSPLGLPSPDWALGSASAQFSAVEVFSLSRARDSMYAALTSPLPETRRAAFGDAFACLGHVVHHVQDMAQPQHVRNDPHAGEYFPFGLGGPPSLYEHYVEATFADAVPAVAPQAIALPTARSYWTNAQQLGIADFTNQNFVSAGRNFAGTAVAIQPNASYPLPNGAGASIQGIQWQNLEVQGGEIPSTFPGDSPLPLDLVYFIGTPIQSGGATVDFNHRTSTYSIWDEYLATFPPYEATFTLNKYNLVEARNRLLPRATIYSAGLIDHFFRGMWRNDEPTLRLMVVPDGGGQPKLSVTNDTPDPFPAGGTFEIWYDRREDGQRAQLGSPALLEGEVAPGMSTEVDLPLAQLHAEAQPDGQIVVLFRGDMAFEQNGIAARVCNCDAPDPECEPLCPCRYLEFAQGDPGPPGDGVVVTPADPVFSCPFGNCRWSRQFLTLAEPLLLGEYPDGFTLAFFAANGRTDLRTVLGFRSASTASCSFCQTTSTGSGPSETAFAMTGVNDLPGVTVPYSDEDVDLITSGACSCGGGTSFPIDSFWKVEFCYGDGPLGCGSQCLCASTAVPIDAVRICPLIP